MLWERWIRIPGAAAEVSCPCLPMVTGGRPSQCGESNVQNAHWQRFANQLNSNLLDRFLSLVVEDSMLQEIRSVLSSSLSLDAL